VSAPVPAAPPLLETTELVFRRPTGFELRTLPIALARGRSLAIRGPSGCGKSTLLALLAGELVPSEGDIRFEGRSLSAADDRTRRAHRATRCGQVFQTFELVASLDVLANTLLPLRLHPALTLDAAAIARARELLARVGLSDKHHRSIDRLSHGERQRVAIARALIARPALILADEPTGNLDPARKREIAALLRDEAAAAGAALVIATHDESILDMFDEVRAIDGGSP